MPALALPARRSSDAPGHSRHSVRTGSAPGPGARRTTPRAATPAAHDSPAYAPAQQQPRLRAHATSPAAGATPARLALRGGDVSAPGRPDQPGTRSEENKSELQSLMRNSHADFCSNTKNQTINTTP